jgi:Peptidase family M23
MMILRAIVLLTLCLAVVPVAAEDFALGPPIDCKIGVDCWVQQYVDHDASQGVKDYHCGGETYDGHDGTDFRVRDITQHVAVLASADGVVRVKRDGVEDRLPKTDQDHAAVKKTECGNGVVIDHAGGWQTQYCHMRKGSVRVKAGDTVKAGDALGEVGYSGEAAFPHVHLTVRKGKKALDPFGGEACSADQKSLWRAQPAYDPGDIIRTGFQRAAVELMQLESGTLKDEDPTREWPALVAYVWAINLQENDEVNVNLNGPSGLISENSVVLKSNKAQFMLFAGKKQPPNGWPAGIYKGNVTVRHAGVARLNQSWQIEIK